MKYVEEDASQKLIHFGLMLLSQLYSSVLFFDVLVSFRSCDFNTDFHVSLMYASALPSWCIGVSAKIGQGTLDKFYPLMFVDDWRKTYLGSFIHFMMNLVERFLLLQLWKVLFASFGDIRMKLLSWAASY